ncbi:MAG: glycosyltransferase [Planctomycetota bacterium]
MRISLISREFAPFFGAGIGTYASVWSRALAAAGHEVHVVTRDHRGLRERSAELFPGVTFHVVDPADGPPRLDHNYGYSRHALAVLATVRRLHERRPFDVIEYPEYWAEGHAVGRAARSLGEFAGAVTVCRLHMSSALCRDLDGDLTYPHYAATLDIMEHESIADADLVLSPSTDLLRRSAERMEREVLGGVSRGAVLRYPFDGVDDLGAVGSAKPRRERPMLLCPGRLERRKGQDVLVSALALLGERGIDADLLLAGADTGSGPFGRSMRKHLVSLVAKHGLAGRVRMLGPVPRDELGPLIASADLCVFPARWDNFPNALLEAMASGAAVVATRAGGPGEIVEGGISGWLCEPESPASLAGALEAALSDHDGRQALAAAAPQRIAAICDPGQVVRDFERLVSEASRARRPLPDVVDAGEPDERPLVSVIVPHFDLLEYLPETLASVRSQTYSRTEIIVVDDGSTDPAVPAALERLEADGVRVVRQVNAGLSAARNAGLKAARGEFVLPIDADDIVSPTFVEKALRALLADPGAAYATSLVGYFRESPRRHFGGWVPLGLHRDLLPIHNCGGCCMAVFRRSAVEEVGGYCESLTSYEDWDLYCSLAERGWRGVVLPDFLLHYRIRPDSMMRSEGEVRKQHLYAAVLARHPGLASDHTRVQRTLLSQRMEAANIARAGLRYKLADRVNVALKRSPLHGAVKGLAERTIDARRARRRSDT